MDHRPNDRTGLIEAVRAGASPAELLACDLPSRLTAAYLLKSDGSTDKDVRRIGEDRLTMYRRYGQRRSC